MNAHREGPGGRGTRRGRRWAKSLATLVAVLLVLALVALVVAPRLMPGDRLAARVASALAAATGADVEVGSASLTLAGGPGLHLRDVRLRDGDRHDVSLSQMDVSLAVSPLLRRTLIVDGVRAAGPSARAVWQGQPLALTDFALRADHLSFPVPLAADLGGVAQSEGPGAAPGAWLPAGLSGSFSGTAAAAGWSSFELSDVACSGTVRRRVLTVHALTAGCGGGHLEAAGTVDFAADPAGAFDGGVRVEAVASGALLSAWTPDLASQLSAPLTGSARAACRLGNAATARATLVADGRLTGGAGILHAASWLGDAERFLGDRQDLVDIRIRELKHVFRVAEGRYQVDTLTIDGPDTQWDLGGSATLDGVLDMGVHVRLPAGFTPQLGSLSFFAEALRDDERRVNLDLRLRGPLPDPAVTLDLTALSRRARKPATDVGKP